MAATCIICCEETSIKNPLLSCPTCAFTACQTCCHTYLLSKPADPHCMSCRKEWSAEFVMEHATREWIRTEFKAHLGSILCERERALLPYTQPEARAELEIRELREKIRELPTFSRMQKCKARPALIQHTMAQRKLYQEEINNRKPLCSLYRAHAEEEPATQLVQLISKCPVAGCRGYVDDSYTCGTCSAHICSKCHEQTTDTESHVCVSAHVASVALIRLETKPCPKCMVPIFKTGGCDQMFCVQCHVAFSWSTGKLDNGVIHNPYYYEWLANQGASATIPQIEDIACGEIPAPDTVRAMMYQACMHQHASAILLILRMAHHMEHAVLPELREDKIRDNNDLRIYYLVGDLTEAEWSSRLAHREFKRLKLRAFTDLVKTSITVLKDLVRTMLHTPTNQTMHTVEQQFNGFSQYYRGMVEKILAVHGGSKPWSVPRTLRDAL